MDNGHLLHGGADPLGIWHPVADGGQKRIVQNQYPKMQDIVLNGGEAISMVGLQQTCASCLNGKNQAVDGHPPTAALHINQNGLHFQMIVLFGGQDAAVQGQIMVEICGIAGFRRRIQRIGASRDFHNIPPPVWGIFRQNTYISSISLTDFIVRAFPLFDKLELEIDHANESVFLKYVRLFTICLSKNTKLGQMICLPFGPFSSSVFEKSNRHDKSFSPIMKNVERRTKFYGI